MILSAGTVLEFQPQLVSKVMWHLHIYGNFRDYFQPGDSLIGDGNTLPVTYHMQSYKRTLHLKNGLLKGNKKTNYRINLFPIECSLTHCVSLSAKCRKTAVSPIQTTLCTYYSIVLNWMSMVHCKSPTQCSGANSNTWHVNDVMENLSSQTPYIYI